MKNPAAILFSCIVGVLLAQLGCAARTETTGAAIPSTGSALAISTPSPLDTSDPPAITMSIQRLHRDVASKTWIADAVLTNNTNRDLFVDGVDLMLQVSNTTMVDARGVHWANDGHPRACVSWGKPPSCGVAIPAHSTTTLQLAPFPGSRLTTAAALYAMNRNEQEPPSRVWYVTRGTVRTGQSLGAPPTEHATIGGSGAADVESPAAADAADSPRNP